MSTFFARQPILDRSLKVAGYELLYRSSVLSEGYDGRDASEATSRVVADCLFSIGRQTLVAGKRAFINFNRDLLVHGYANVLPPESVVIEILETTEPDEEVIASCQELKARGFLLALDDYVHHPRLEPFLKIADIIKVDVESTDENNQRELMKGLASRGVKFLAEKVETFDQFVCAHRLGYSYFQGYFFARPTIVAGSRPSTIKTKHYRLLTAIHRSPFDYHELELLIERDVSFAYTLLTYINSIRFAWYARIESIKQALLLMGEDEIRKWAYLVVVHEVAGKKPLELMILATIRARFCELVGNCAGVAHRRSDLFLMGLFSLLDAMMDRSLEEILAGIHLHTDVKAALLGTAPADSRFAAIYRLVRAYEVGEWNGVADSALWLGVPESALPAFYRESVEWSEDGFRL